MVVSVVFPSSMVMTPPLPAFLIASEIKVPISSFPDAETTAIFLISWSFLTGMERASSSFIRASRALSMPRFSPIGLAPAAMFFTPFSTRARKSKMVVVVPSPHFSFILAAASLAIEAPMFWYWSLNSMSLTMLLPSFVIVGAPQLAWSPILRPLGPRVTLTTSASFPIPSRSFSLACSSKMSSFAVVMDYLLLKSDLILSTLDVDQHSR